MSVDTDLVAQLRRQMLLEKTRADLYEECANDMCQRWLAESALADRLADALWQRVQRGEVVYALTVHSERRAQDRERGAA